MGALLDECRTISDLQTLRVLADAKRLRLLEQFEQPSSVKEVAARVGIDPSKLYYHVKLLLERDLLRVTGSRPVSGIEEKSYQAVARCFRVDRALLTLATGDAGRGANLEALDSYLQAVFDVSADAILATAARGGVDLSLRPPQAGSLYLHRSELKLGTERAAELYRRIHELVDEFANDDGDEAGDEMTYGLVVALSPIDANAIDVAGAAAPEGGDG